jgi:YidC/Oxa1 family membrane protein insertase
MLSPIVDVFRGALFALAHWTGGSLGGAIVVAAAALRIVMMPLSLRAARRRFAREARLRVLAPAMAELQRRHAGQPAALAAAVRQLHQRHGVSLVDRASFVESLLQFPAAAALYSAIRGLPRGAARFLWMSDLVPPDRGLALLTAFVSAGATWMATSSGESGRAAQLAPIMTAAVTFAILSHLSAGVALYSLTNSVVGGVEQALARRMLRDGAP